MKDVSRLEVWEIKTENCYCPYLVMGKCNYNRKPVLPWCKKEICKIKI